MLNLCASITDAMVKNHKKIGARIKPGDDYNYFK